MIDQQTLRHDIAQITGLLRVHDPAPSERLTDDELPHLTQIRVAVFDRIAEDAKAGVAQPRHESVTPRARRPVQSIAVAAAVVVAVAAAVTVASSGHQSASATPALPLPLRLSHGDHQGAVDLLNAAASAQAKRSDGGGAVRYAKTQNYALQVTVSGRKSTTVVATTIREVWESPDGSTLVREYRQDTEPAGGDVGGPRPLGGLDHNGQYGPGQWADPNRGLPTSLSEVLAALHNANGDGNPQLRGILLADSVAEHLSVGTASPQQVAALYQVLASLPGVFDAGTVTDSTGRTGETVGMVISDSGSLVTGTAYFVIDSATGAFQQVETVDTPGPPPALKLPPVPTVQEYETVLSAGLVGSIGQAPASASHG